MFFDPLSSSPTTPDWSISNNISSILSLKESFFICSFSWVKGECNARAHAAAKLSLSNFQLFCFNNLSIPNVLKTVCEVDCHYLFPNCSLISFDKIEDKKKKKNCTTMSYNCLSYGYKNYNMEKLNI